MSDFNDREFDSRIRSLLENAEEEVPDRVWNAISGRLDAGMASTKRKAVLPWLRYAGAAAVAAAVVLAVFLDTGNHTQNTGVQDISHMSAQALLEPEETQGKEQEPEQAVRTAIAEYRGTEPEVAETEGISAETYTVIPEPEDTAAVAEGKETTESEAKNDRPESITSQIRDAEAGTYTAEAWTDPFAEDSGTDDRRIHTALTISGLAASNNGSGMSAASSRPMMSYGKPGSENGSPITEKPGTESYGIPLSFGVGAKVIFTPRWSLGVGLNYSLLSRTFSGTYTAYTINGISQSTPYSKIRNSQSYIGIPVNVYFSIMKNRIVDFYAYAGGTAEKCIINRYTVPGNEIVYNEKVNGFQFSADAGIGVEFIVADMLGIYIDPSIRYYFPDSRQPKSIRTVQPLMLGFEMGFRVRL